MLIKKICLGILISFLFLTAYIIQAGIALVDVKTPEVHLWIPVPVALGHLAGEFVDLPQIDKKEWAELMEHRAAVTEILRQLRYLPDANFVEVEKAEEHIRIYKQADALWVSVNTPQEKVEVRLPLKMVEHLIAVLNSQHPTVGDIISCLEWQTSGDLVRVDTGRERVRISLL
jgi:hypothetical protein